MKSLSTLFFLILVCLIPLEKVIGYVENDLYKGLKIMHGVYIRKKPMEKKRKLPDLVEKPEN